MFLEIFKFFLRYVASNDVRTRYEMHLDDIPKSHYRGWEGGVSDRNSKLMDVASDQNHEVGECWILFIDQTEQKQGPKYAQ